MSMTCTDPSPWQATNNSSSRNAMSIGWLPTGIAVCCRNDGSIKLTVPLLRLVTAKEAVIGRVARDLRRFGHAFEAHLVGDAAFRGVDQEQRGLRVIDRYHRAAVWRDRDAGE